MNECEWCDSGPTDGWDAVTGTAMCEHCRADLTAGLAAQFAELDRRAS